MSSAPSVATSPLTVAAVTLGPQVALSVAQALELLRIQQQRVVGLGGPSRAADGLPKESVAGRIPGDDARERGARGSAAGKVGGAEAAGGEQAGQHLVSRRGKGQASSGMDRHRAM